MKDNIAFMLGVAVLLAPLYVSEAIRSWRLRAARRRALALLAKTVPGT